MNPRDQLGRYRLVERLASGGMGEVFLARAEGPAGFSKRVVVKRMLSHLTGDADFVTMFLNEARLAASLNHPNIAQVFELGEDRGEYFIAMEHVHGRSLRAVLTALALRGAKLEPVQAARLASQALAGLHSAHTRHGDDGRPAGLVHRDVSPENLLVSFDGLVKVVDFGVARAVASSRVTKAGPKGKYGYMAPEQLHSLPVDARADVFSMGVVLYEMLAGATPFKAKGGAELIAEMLTRPVQPLAELAPALPRELCEVTARAMHARPEQRYATALEMAQALDAWLLARGETPAGGPLVTLLGELFGEAARLPPPSVDLEPPQPTENLKRGIPSPSLDVAPQLAAVTASIAPTLVPRGPWRGLFAGSLVVALLATGTAVAVAMRTPQAAPIPALNVVVPAAPAPAAGVELAPEADELEVTLSPSAQGKKPARTGSVSIRVHPWAEVWFHGKKLGLTPLDVALPAGRQLLVLKNPALSVEKSIAVQVPAGAEVLVKDSLAPAAP